MNEDEKQFEKFVRGIKFDDTPDYSHRDRLELDMLAALAKKTRQQEQSLTETWRIIMKSRITKLTAAAAIIFIAAFVINHFSSTTVVYGVTEVLELCKKARTIHIQGRSFYPEFPEQNQVQQAIGFEIWLDIENGRSRIKSPGRVTKDGQTTFNYYENVIDGHYRMYVDHFKKSITYYKLDEAEQQLIALDFDFQLKQMFGDPEQIEAYVLIGSEQIDGSEYDIWQAEIQADPDSQIWLRIKIWLSPITGEIVRVVTWHSRDRVDWFRTYEFDKIERNVSLSDELFETKPPEGYVANNTKETPKEKRLAKSSWYGKEAAIAVYQGLALEDGSVIIVFSSTNRKSGGAWTPGDELADISQIEVFENLIPGGPLPELPIVVSALKRKSLWRGTTLYVGRHLTYTQKDNKLYEWAIYVPTQEKQTSRSAVGYESFEAILRFNPPDLEANWNYKIGATSGRYVDVENFNTVLLKYMTDLCDDVLIPEDLTYESVLQLARQIRDSLGE
jgi:hypothetical protein